jgi:hypothetical protein
MSPNGPESIPHTMANFLVTKLTDTTIWVQEKNNERREKARRLADEQVDREANDTRRRALDNIDGEDRSLMGDRQAEEGRRRPQEREN